jgi:hypothetical protein
MHGAPHADGALELTTSAPDGAAVLGSRQLGVNVSREKRPLHDELTIANGSSRGNVVLT